MIGCIGYTSVIECSQYVQDVHLIKSIYLISLLIISVSLIYYSKTKSYKRLQKKYQSYKTMLGLPVFLSYFAIFTTLIGSPGLMSVNTNLDDFGMYIWAYLLPSIVWVIVMVFYFIIDWTISKVGFSSVSAFIKAARKK